MLEWAADAAGVEVEEVVSLHEGTDRGSGSYRLRVIDRGSGTAGQLVLKVPVPDWIGPKMVTTNARALQLAASYGLPVPRLVAADLDGRRAGTVATLETLLPGSSGLPPTVDVARLESAGAAIASAHAHPLAASVALPYRPRPVAVDDFAGERRRGQMPTTPLLQHADEHTQQHGVPAGSTVFVHGDTWTGNMLYTDDTHPTVLIDWKTAGVGHPGVDLGGLRLHAALHYGLGVADHVLHGWERQARQPATALPYWDAIAALNTPTELGDYPGFAENGSRLDTAAVTERRDTFLRAALDGLRT